MRVRSSSSLSGLRTVDLFPVFPMVFAPGLSWLPLTGFDFAGLVVWLILAPRSRNTHSQSGPFSRFITFWCLCETSWSPPLFPRSLRRSFASGLAVSIASLPLVSRPWTVLSWPHLMSLRSVVGLLVVVPRQLVGSGVCSPASTICPPSSFMKQHSFGFSASIYSSESSR